MLPSRKTELNIFLFSRKSKGMIHFRFVIVVFDIFEETSNQIMDRKTRKASMQCKAILFSVSIEIVVELKGFCMAL